MTAPAVSGSSVLKQQCCRHLHAPAPADYWTPLQGALCRACFFNGGGGSLRSAVRCLRGHSWQPEEREAVFWSEGRPYRLYACERCQLTRLVAFDEHLRYWAALTAADHPARLVGPHGVLSV